MKKDLTFKNNIPVTRPTKKNRDDTIFGKANGYLFRSLLLPKVSGNREAGLASAPPNAGPKMLPVVVG